jgi:hypothetical protein
MEAVLSGYKEIIKGSPKTVEQDLRLAVLRGNDFALPQEINDMAAFITWGKAHDQTPAFIAAQLMHDLNGIAEMDRCFSPRTAGYYTLMESATIKRVVHDDGTATVVRKNGSAPGVKDWSQLNK